MNYELIGIPAITTVVYWIINLLKYTLNNSEKFKRFIPITAAVLGVLIAVICFYFVPGVLATKNIFVAIILGGASGLSATGVNQAIKQILKQNDNKE